MNADDYITALASILGMDLLPTADGLYAQKDEWLICYSQFNDIVLMKCHELPGHYSTPIAAWTSDTDPIQLAPAISSIINNPWECIFQLPNEEASYEYALRRLFREPTAEVYSQIIKHCPEPSLMYLLACSVFGYNQLFLLHQNLMIAKEIGA